MSIISRGKGPHHKKVIEEVEKIKETDANEHQSSLPDKIIFNTEVFQSITWVEEVGTQFNVINDFIDR